MIRELHLVFMIKDKSMASKKRYTKIPKYIMALIKLLQ